MTRKHRTTLKTEPNDGLSFALVWRHLREMKKLSADVFDQFLFSLTFLFCVSTVERCDAMQILAINYTTGVYSDARRRKRSQKDGEEAAPTYVRFN